MRWLLMSLFIFSTPVFADLAADDTTYDNYDSYDENEEYESKRLRYEDRPDSSILRDEAHWPSQNEDPFLESLSR